MLRFLFFLFIMFFKFLNFLFFDQTSFVFHVLYAIFINLFSAEWACSSNSFILTSFNPCINTNIMEYMILITLEPLDIITNFHFSKANSTVRNFIKSQRYSSIIYFFQSWLISFLLNTFPSFLISSSNFI